MLNKNFLTKSRWLVTIILLLSLSIGDAWGAGAVSVSSSTIVFPKGSTSVSKGDWKSAGAPTAYSTTATDYTINSAGSFTFYNAADYDNSTTNFLQLKASGGYIETTITSTAGVDITIGYKTGSANNLTISLDGASNVTGNSTSGYTTANISTTNTSAKFKIHKSNSGVAYISYIQISPKSGSGSTGDFVLVESTPASWEGEYLIVYNNTNAMNTHYGNADANTYATYTDISSYYTSATKTIASNATTEGLVYVVSSSTNGHTIKRKAATEYLGYNNTNNGAYLRWDGSITANQNEWTLGVGSIVSVYNTGKAIRWNTGSPRFAIYATNGQSAIQLFKRATASSCSEPTDPTNGSFF